MHPFHSTALLFLEYFYTGCVKWPGGHAELDSALELLVMACTYDVQHLVCIAEMALQALLGPDNCCSVLSIADHHQAGQLRERCLHYLKQGHWMFKTSEEYKLLSDDLKAELESSL